MSYEVIQRDGMLYAEIIWADTRIEKTRFYSPAASSFQFGLLAHGAGYIETPHFHRPVKREITDVQQMFVVQRGVVAVEFYTNEGKKFHEVVLKAGDAVNLVHGAHAIRILEDMQCISIKQGPFLGDEMDRVNVGK
jgi:hypothetical protein